MLGYVRCFLPSGIIEVGTYRPQELKHEIATRFNLHGQLIFKSQWKNGMEVKVLFNDDPDCPDYEIESNRKVPEIKEKTVREIQEK